MAEEICNPWAVTHIDSFNFLCCPECVFRSKEISSFQSHAVENHPKSKILFCEKEEISFQKHAIEEPPFCNVLFKDSNSIEIDPLKVESTVKYDIDSMSELNTFREKEDFEEMSIEDLKVGSLEFQLMEQVNLSVNIVSFKTDFVIPKTMNDETAKDPKTIKCDAS